MDSKILAIVLLGSCFLIDATSATDPPKKAETTDPATMTEYEGVSCKKRFSTGNSPGGAKATCIKDPTCWAVEGKYYCKGKKGGHIFTKKDGLVNLVEKDGAKVWIKNHCADNVKNQGEEGVDCGGPCAKAC